LNLKVSLPFNFNDYIVGIKHTFGGDELAPEAIFARKSWRTDIGSWHKGWLNGAVGTDLEYNTRKNVFSGAIAWAADKLGTKLGMEMNSKDIMKSLSLSTSHEVKDTKVKTSVDYQFPTKMFTGKTNVAYKDTAVDFKCGVKCDSSKEVNPVLSLTQKIDDANEISPSFSFKDKSANYKWTHKLGSGKVASTLFPGDKVLVDWTDNAAEGAWVLSSEIPLEDRKASKISVKRDWTL
jgi:hypothetical protein